MEKAIPMKKNKYKNKNKKQNKKIVQDADEWYWHVLEFILDRYQNTEGCVPVYDRYWEQVF